MNSIVRFAIKSRRVCTPDGVRPAAIIVEGEEIVDVVASESVSDNMIVRDVENLIVSPGIIDAHVHVNDPGSDWEGFESATKAAAAGGVTTLVDMPLNSLPVTTTVDALRRKQAAARGRCWVDVGFHGGLIPGNVNDIEALIEDGCCGIKTFLCHSGLNQFPMVAEDDLRKAMTILKKHGIPLLVHAELVDKNTPPLPEGTTSYQEYLQSRPDEWELNAIQMMIRLCEELDAAVHITPLSTQKASLMIADAKEAGVPLTIETCPHYLYFCAEKIPAGATNCKCTPPIRSDRNRKRLLQALYIDLIDTIGSGHSPSHPDMKALDSGDFSKAWAGISGLQFSLPVVWTAGKQLGWEAPQLATWLSENPAKLIGLEKRKGKIAAGFDADLVIWDPDSRFQVEAKGLYHRHKISAYDGQELIGVVHQTFLRGNCVFDRGGLSRTPMGHLISRKQSRNGDDEFPII